MKNKESPGFLTSAARKIAGGSVGTIIGSAFLACAFDILSLEMLNEGHEGISLTSTALEAICETICTFNILSYRFPKADNGLRVIGAMAAAWGMYQVCSAGCEELYYRARPVVVNILSPTRPTDKPTTQWTRPTQ